MYTAYFTPHTIKKKSCIHTTVSYIWIKKNHVVSKKKVE